MKLSYKVSTLALVALGHTTHTLAFTFPGTSVSVAKSRPADRSYTTKSASLFPSPREKFEFRNKHDKPITTAAATSAALSPSDGENNKSEKNGLFTFKTKYGYLNPYAIYYGLVSILLGLPWFVALTLCDIFYKITNNKFDKMRRVPVFFSHIWGTFLLRLSRSYPEIEGYDKLKEFYKQNRAAMFVANHNSWMDIPFVGITVGWRNYKLISKAELFKVPILGKGIATGGHVMVDRSSRKSQLITFKAGMQWLKDGVHLCAFPEGTRSKTGRLLPFKNGAFKMAHKVGAPVIPFSIVASGKVHPANWMFPRRASHGICKVVIHDPIESNDKTEKELAEIIRSTIISGLPEDQRPLE